MNDATTPPATDRTQPHPFGLSLSKPRAAQRLAPCLCLQSTCINFLTQRLLPLLACALALGATGAEARNPSRHALLEGVTTRVIDGDSLWFAPVQQGQRQAAIEVRLARIDAPEICQLHGRESQRALVALALNKAGRLQGVARDSYGRLVAHLEVDGVDVAKRLVEEGQAWSARQRNDRGPLVKQERMARALARGLHATGGAVMPSEFRRGHGPCDGAVAADEKKPATVAGAGLR